MGIFVYLCVIKLPYFLFMNIIVGVLAFVLMLSGLFIKALAGVFVLWQYWEWFFKDLFSFPISYGTFLAGYYLWAFVKTDTKKEVSIPPFDWEGVKTFFKPLLKVFWLYFIVWVFGWILKHPLEFLF